MIRKSSSGHISTGAKDVEGLGMMSQFLIHVGPASTLPMGKALAIVIIPSSPGPLTQRQQPPH